MPIDLKLDRQSHVYNVREDRYVGYTDRLSTDVEPGEALLYALLSYQVDEVYLDGPAQSTVGQRAAFEVSVIPAQGSQPGMHCLHVEVANPGGQAIPLAVASGCADATHNGLACLLGCAP